MATDDVNEVRVERWDRATEVPLLVASLAFFVAFALPIVWYPAPERVVEVCTTVEWLTWGMFAVDYAVRLSLSRSKRTFVRNNWFDLLVIALPMLRPMRLLRLLTVVSVMNKRAAADMRGKVGLYVAVAAGMLATVGALAVLDVERGAPGANITTVGQAFWWAAATMTTVGYGDVYPVTGLGRVIAVGLMVGGVAVLGAVTGTLASWIVEKVSDASGERETLDAELRELRKQVASLRDELHS